MWVWGGTGGGGGGLGVISGGAYKEQFRVFMQHIPVL